MTLTQRIKRAFLAQAVGDAFCDPYEFSTPTPIRVLADYRSDAPISITDDTQMAMFGLYALGCMRRDKNIIGQVDLNLETYIKTAYLSWYATQTVVSRRSWTWLEREPLMQKRRAPGNTCMGALASLSTGVEAHNNSKGNGAVMRTLPFVFAPDLLGVSRPAAINLAARAGYLTHKHSESERAIRAYMSTAFQLLDRAPGDLMPVDISVAQVGGDTFTAMPAFEAAIVALRNSSYVPRTDDPFGRIVYQCAMSGGDADTIAAIAGGLWGLTHEAPVELVKRLVERDIIERLVEWAVGEGDVRSDSQEVRSRPAARASGEHGRGSMDR